MLRFSGTPSSEPTTISPRLTLPREGLDLNPKRPYFIAESEIPREGVRLTQAFQRARWTSGKTYVWLGARKQVGRGEHSSGLAFDEIANAPPDQDGRD